MKHLIQNILAWERGCLARIGRRILMCTVAITVTAGCQLPNDQTAKRPNGQTPDSLYTEGKAMSMYRNDPERAITIIDSAVIVGNITPGHAKYLKAVTQYGGFENLPLARQMCIELTEERPDSETVQQAYHLLTVIEYSSGQFPAVILYATEASRRAHDLDMPVEVANMEGYIAQAMSETGRSDEGIGHLKATLDALKQMDTFGGITTYHNVSKKLLHILLNNGRYAEMVPVCESMLVRVDELAQHPERFTGMADGFDPGEFIDFALGQTQAFLTVAYARQYEAAKTPPTEVTPAVRSEFLKKARQAQAEVMRTKWSRSVDCDRMMTAAYQYLGQFDRFDAAMSRLDAIRSDTINASYFISLELRSEAARMQGKTEEALHYLQRAFVINDSLTNHNQREQINELATLYHLQEEQIARYQAEADARFLRWITAAVIIILVIAIAFAIYIFYKRRETMKKNRVLAQQIAEIVSLRSSQQDACGASRSKNSLNDPLRPTGRLPGQSEQEPTNTGDVCDAELFRQLRDVILRERLFLDPRLDRQSLCDRFSLSNVRIGAAFAKGSPYKSLIDFLNECRLPYAARLLTQRPDLSIADVARESGFLSADTFGRNFKQKYTLTPTQYRDINK